MQEWNCARRTLMVAASVLVIGSTYTLSGVPAHAQRGGERSADGTVGELKVGVARRSIMPEPLLPISGGMGPTVPAKGHKGELMARGVVLQSGGTEIAIVSVDLLGFPAVLADRARSRIPGIPPECVLIAATHTHSAPDCYAFPDGQGGHTGDLDYMDHVCEMIAATVNEAQQRAQPAKLRIGTGEVQGKVAYNYYAPDLYDRRASVVQAVDHQGDAIATLVNYAVHPEVLGADLGLVSPDLVGPMCERIEATVGGMAMFVNGAQGGMITADNRDLERLPSDAKRGYWHDIRNWQEAVRIGNRLADEALRIIGEVRFEHAPKITCHHVDVRFPVESDALWAVVTASPLNYPHGNDRSITSRIHLLQLGSAQVLTIPGEAMPNIGFYLKRKMRGTHNLLFGLTNDAFGYILTKVDFNSFPRYNYVSRVSLGEMTGEILIEQSLDLIHKVSAPGFSD